MNGAWRCSLALLLVHCASGAPAATGGPWLPEYWNQQALDSINAALKRVPNTNIAKNLIFVIGDGMGVSTLTAARIFKGQQEGRLGEDEYLVWEKFPHLALSKTYNTDAMTADSAGTATAYHYGFKTKFGVIGTDDRVIKGECSTEATASSSPFKNVLQLAEIAGKSTGIVTTTRITHASPSPLYAKSAHRDWEADSDLPPSARNKCKDIALQLIENGLDIEVVMGGGRKKFMRTNDSDPEYPAAKGDRADGRNLIEEWQEKQALKNKKCKYVWNKEGFDNTTSSVECVLGLFEPSHMLYEEQKLGNSTSEPTLTQMVEKAIQILQKNPNGFYLFIEGGKIDHAHHESRARYALSETVELHRAVERALSMTSSDDTLTVVSADHSHVFNLAGYPSRGTPILGLMSNVEPGYDNAADNKPYTVLVYGNGPGHREPRENLTGVKTDDPSYTFQSAVPMSSESHGGEDVAIYADGPMAHLFHGLQEQTYIPHVMAYAACLGQKTGRCLTPSTTAASRSTVPNADKVVSFVVSLSFITWYL